MPKTLPFLKNFKCQSCTNCCRNWDVPLIQEDLDRLTQAITSQYGSNRLKDFIIDKDQQGFTVASLAKKSNQACVFLNEQTNLCDIQTHFGHEFLPTVCRTFPRLRTKVGSRDTYALSTTCPSVQKLLDHQGDIEIDDDQDFDTQNYAGLKHQIESQTISLRHRQLDGKAFEALQEGMVKAFNQTALDVDDVLLYLATLIIQINDSPGDSVIDVQELGQFLNQQSQTNWQALAQQLKTLPLNLASHLNLMQAVLKLRASLGKMDDPILSSLFDQYLDLKTDDAFLQDYQSRYQQYVTPLLSEHHWIVRNFLASHLLVEALSVKQDFLPGGLLMSFFSYSLIKMILIEMSSINQNLVIADLMKTIELTEMFMGHHPQFEDQLTTLMKQNSFNARSILHLVRL